MAIGALVSNEIDSPVHIPTSYTTKPYSQTRRNGHFKLILLIQFFIIGGTILGTQLNIIRNTTIETIAIIPLSNPKWITTFKSGCSNVGLIQVMSESVIYPVRSWDSFAI